jgi:hypothetical protein
LRDVPHRRGPGAEPAAHVCRAGRTEQRLFSKLAERIKCQAGPTPSKNNAIRYGQSDTTSRRTRSLYWIFGFV